MPPTLTLEKILISLIIFLSFYLITSNRIDPDLGWHLESGKWIIENHQIQHLDEFSHTMSGYEWVNHEWLVDISLWLLNQNNLWWLTAPMFCFMAAIAFVYYISKSKSLPEIWIYSFLTVVILPYIGVRPQIISVMLFFILHRLLLSYFNHPKAKYTYFLIPLLFLVWSNLHAGFASGLLLLIIMALGYYWDNRQNKLKIPIISTIALLIISIATTFINPYFHQIYLEIFRVFLSGETAKYISEWKPALSQLSIITPIFIALCLFALYKFYRQISFIYTLPIIFFLFGYLKSNRLAPMLIIVLMPYLELCFKIFKNQLKTIEIKFPTPPKKQTNIKLLGTIMFIPLLLCFFLTSIRTSNINYPTRAIQFLTYYQSENNINNIYNSYTWGGYIIHNMPGTKVFIDGRMPHWVDQFGHSAMKDYLTTLQSESNANWYQIFDQHEIKTAIIPNPDLDISYHQLLKQKINNKHIYNFVEKYISPEPNNLKQKLLEKNWQIIYQDDVASILQRPKQ